MCIRCVHMNTTVNDSMCPRLSFKKVVNIELFAQFCSNLYRSISWNICLLWMKLSTGIKFEVLGQVIFSAYAFKKIEKELSSRNSRTHVPVQKFVNFLSKCLTWHLFVLIITLVVFTPLQVLQILWFSFFILDSWKLSKLVKILLLFSNILLH